MFRPRWSIAVACAVPCLLATLAAPLVARAFEPAAPEVCGELSIVEGLRVLKVWGTSQQRGFAHGYLLAGDIKRVFEAFLKDARMSGGPEGYQRRLLPLAQTMMHARPLHEREIRAIADGIRARLGADGAMIAGLGRPLEYGDLLALNALSDRFGPGCSSFSVWGPRTTDGHTLTARNLDWPRLDWMIGEDVVLVQLPSKKPARRGWVSLNWPGYVGCLSGMNDAGLTLAMHDVPIGGPDGMRRFLPRGLVLREALEKCGGPGAIGQTADLFRQRPIAVGTNIFATVPFDPAGGLAPAAVLEYDGRIENADGVTVRSVEEPASATWLVCTNHFRRRVPAEGCGRYGLLSETLAAESSALDVAKVWQIAASVNVPQPRFNPMFTYHTLVFEPDTLRLHLATADREQPAGKRAPVAFDLAEWLRPAASAKK